MSDRAFISLTPANALARLAFSDAYDTLMSRCQHSQADNAQVAFRRMHVKPEQIYDKEILHIRREMDNIKYTTDGDESEPLTELDTDTENLLKESGMIWVGHYLLTLEPPPAIPERGWTAGKGPLENLPIDLILCTRPFAKSHSVNLRNPHARFNFFVKNMGLYIMGCSKSPLAQLTVNGDTVVQPYHLNQYNMNITFDKLEYRLQWIEFAADDNFNKQRREYMTRFFGAMVPADMDVEMPTPLPSKRTVGGWTLGDALGAGGCGRVFFASDQSGDIAAIKLVERTALNHHSVDKEIETLREVTDLAQRLDDHERILRMTEVIYTNGKEFSSKMAFDNVTLVLKPMTPRTFRDLMAQSAGGCNGMTIEAASAFRNALLGVKIMHDGCWVHRDLKPTNIGLIGKTHSVLLDIGTSKPLPAGQSLEPKPGTAGTIGYLAPEFELDNYDHSIDIWSMAVILFELTYHYHPWKFSINPWRNGDSNEKLRPTFLKSYQSAIDQMSRDYKNARTSPLKGYIHLGDLFIEMVRHKWASNNHGPRPDIDQVLLHPAWGPLLPESPLAKKRRLE